jgi:flagellar FliL protein
MADTSPEPRAQKEPKKGKKKLLLILLIVLVLAGGAGGYVVFAGSSESGAASEPVEPPKPEPGALLPLDPITVNLAGGRYLRVGLTVQMGKAKDTKEEEAPDGSKALDQAILLLTNRQADELQTPEQLELLKDELTKRISGVYDGNVLEVLLTQFVIQ